jgi:hypothetical protein
LEADSLKHGPRNVGTVGKPWNQKQQPTV